MESHEVPPEGHVPLRLSVTRGALGLELYETVDVGPLEVTELALTLPNLKFPLDLSGGVPQFRHRRGELERLELRASLVRLALWLEPRSRFVVRGPARVRVWAFEQGLGVGVVGPDSALAFDLLWAPIGADARFVLTNARSAGLEGAALGHALRLVDSAMASHVVRRGRLISFVRVASRIGRAVLPAVGARAPAAGRVQCGELSVNGDELGLAIDSNALPPALTDDACRALELAELVAEADDALAEGKLDAARQGYVYALERAPRHPELCRLIGEIDVAVGGRAEAALGMLVEAMPAVHAGVVASRLMVAVGDREGARGALAESARGERFAPLASLLLTELAALADEPRERLRALDDAVARAPSLEPARWARFEARLALRDVEGALSDAQHAEAAATGGRAKHATCERAARALRDAGFVRDAGKLFERALRFLPDDPQATAGLARSLVEAGRVSRAFALFERALALGEKHNAIDATALVDLGKLLANEYRDLPQAIARVSQVPLSADCAVEARALEARWRASIGDLTGATLAYGRLRDTISLRTPTDPAWSRWLLDAGRFERTIRHDVTAAEPHLAVALRLAPHDAEVQRAYREVAAIIAAERRPPTSHPPQASSPGVPALVDFDEVANDPSAEDPPESAQTGIQDAREDAELDNLAGEAERLEAALRANPDASDVVMRLVEVLERLGRDQELLAVLSARLEDAEPQERAALLSPARGVLTRLAQAAHRAEREAEAAVYEAMLRRLSDD